jgi:hypothetical protein
VAASNERHRNEANAAMSQNSHQSASAPISLEAIQIIIAEGVKAQYMQTHYSMWLGYVEPYPLEVDMVPFPCVTPRATANLITIIKVKTVHQTP